MKKFYSPLISKLNVLCLSFLLAGIFAQAQNKQETGNIPTGIPGAELAPGVTVTGPSTTNPQALWDIEFNYDITTAGAGAGNAGVVYLGHEFWVARWANDTIWRISPTGSVRGFFIVSGLSGTRGMTLVGNRVYAGNATTTIYEIDTTTKSIAGTITVSSGATARFITYDPTADAGSGGFYIGNFTTDIQLINMSGNTIGVISTATHGLTSMYGAAWENTTAGGPYLWVSYQGGSSSAAQIARLQLPGGTPTVVDHDVMSDVGVGLTGSGGGLFITDQLVSGEHTIVGCLQGNPTNMLFGYELNDFVQPATDAATISFQDQAGYTQIPMAHASGMVFEGEVENVGTDPLAGISFHIDVYNSGGTSVFTDVQTIANLPANATSTVTSTGFTPAAMDTYTAYGYTVISGDTVSSNDSMSYSFAITDTTFARDDNISTGSGYTVSNTDWAYAVSVFETQVFDTLSSVWVRLETPTTGDTTYAVVVDFAGGLPGVVIATGRVELIDAATNEYVLVFQGGVALPAGQYLIGCYEGFGVGIGLSQSQNVFTPGTNYFFTGSGGWSGSNIATARFIRPNFGNPLPVGIEDQVTNRDFAVYPNPTTGMVNVRMNDFTSEGQLTITDMTGRVVLSRQLDGTENLLNLDLSVQESGVYFLRIQTGNDQIVKKISLTR